MQKFMFNQMFDEEVIERQRREEIARVEAERIAEENAPPTFTVEELEAAKLAAHQQGVQEGKAEAMASIEQQANLTLDLVLRQMGDLLKQYKHWTAEVHHDSISMATAIMRKLAPELLRGSELPQVEHIINEAFQFLTDQPKVMIRVASDLEEPLSGKVNLMASRVGYEGQVVLTGDPELELTDCRISWYAGAVERSLDETWEQIDEMVSRVLKGLPAREHPEPKPVEDESESEGESENEADPDTGKMEAQPPELTESTDSEALASASEAGEDIDHSAAVASGTEEEDEDGPAGEPSVPHEHTEPRPALATEE
jgi:flagellar assembly protein FliH